MTWQRSTVAFFVYLAAAALIRPGMVQRARRSILCAAAGALALLAASELTVAATAFSMWIAPPLLLSIGYWASGLLFVSPMPRVEAALLALDRVLHVDAVAGRLPRALVELLEFAYTMVYPLIPIALLVGLRAGLTADRFWAVILATDYVCFATLPWFQTRPPRSLGVAAPWRSRWRDLNMRLLDAVSVQANTFPSGHAAEALAVALLLSGASATVIVVMFGCAAAISAGAVLGRYHYAADALAGWLVALAVYRVAA